MPKKPGLPKRRNTISITWQQILCLIERRNRIPGQHFRDDEQRREAWKNNKTMIMKLQGQPLDIGEDTVALQRSLKRNIWFDYFERPLAFFQYDRHEILTGHLPDDQREFLIEKGLLNAAEKRLLRSETA